MKIPLHITFLNIPPSDAIEAEIRKRAEKLDHFSEHVMHCHVTVDAAGKHHTQGRMFEVHIDLTVPQTEIAISHVHQHENVFIVIRDAFDAAVRKLQDYVREQRGDVKTHEVPLHGRVTKLFEDGYGFIETADGREFYFHRDNLVYPDFNAVAVGTDVQFLEQGGAGEGLQAKRVTAGHHHISG
ncbi:HPF/RaiA family ribosome-associated protein [Noviherbaspirillum sp.]|uniref:HPF/RaiA family ribosome-associated protein n=1 Tax=Noviherbaspirillum sp. TaxID=1926288 RepID=UPI002B463233|nr:HPF/RaiA family ribosome-associated protein [Noviherbaspirillum sp.]HJV80475.1 HPF/RaiA family ribosome-associated protein [Noviherbaspirillum sp.]